MCRLDVTNNNSASIVIVNRNTKPRGRPSFRQIRLHLDIAAQEFIKINPAVYLESQVYNTHVHTNMMWYWLSCTERVAARSEGEVQECTC